MEYTLRYKRGVGVSEQNIKNPSPEMIELVLDELLPSLDYYIVLNSKPMVNNCDCLQTVIKWDDKPIIEFMVEVHFKVDGDFIYYRRYFSSIDEVKKMFRMFALGIIPDVVGWDDVTEEVKEAVRQNKWVKNDG